MAEEYQNQTKSIAIIPVYAETSIGRVLSQFANSIVDEICVVLDAPDSRTLLDIERLNSKKHIPIKLICNKQRRGIGSAIKRGLMYALSRKFDIVIIMAGNGKDSPKEIPRLYEAIVYGDYDYVQGSRYLAGGRSINTPIPRGIFIKLFPLIWTALTRFRCTDVTNGFRAYKTNILKDKRINIQQEWLNGYALEYYIHYKILTLGYKVTEVPVSKIYEDHTNFTKISPLKHWWEIVGPLIMLKLLLRK